MFDITSFLLRWLYLCNIVRDVAQIQLLPQEPVQNQPGHNPLSIQQPQGTSLFDQRKPAQSEELEWKEKAFRWILSSPPGEQRKYAIDSLRVALVQELQKHLKKSDTTLHRYHDYHARRNRRILPDEDEVYRRGVVGDNDPYLDADLEIIQGLGRGKMEEETVKDTTDEEEKETAILVIGSDGTDVLDSGTEEGVDARTRFQKQLEEDVQKVKTRVDKESLARAKAAEESQLPSKEELDRAYKSLADFTDFLPQLVSAVLKSPRGFEPALLDPLQKLWDLLLTRCLHDANWGIELCWLLEAEVGRAWKTIFEHRQKTGKRLIVSVPADQALVIAKIGNEKRAAFELLQDVELATAYGARLPSSLSERRCSHFGDTMHFIDQLTQISLDLRMVPNLQRTEELHRRLEELNRRLRRRMATCGDLTLDVEDGNSQAQYNDISVDMLKYSVHFPLEPKRITWPGGVDEEDEGDSIAHRTKSGVMRVLNIVAPECRLLSSRERCPYLVHMEVAETGLEGSDARLYASGAKNVGTTVEESLRIGQESGQGTTRQAGDENVFGQWEAAPAYQIPRELITAWKIKPSFPQATRSPLQMKQLETDEGNSSEKESENVEEGSLHVSATFPSRGGYQADESQYYYSTEGDYVNPNQYDMVREQQYEQLHEHLHNRPPQSTPTTNPYKDNIDPNAPVVTTRSALLDKVYGLPWKEKCEQIRQTSPYGRVKGWRLASFIMKAGEDIRREALVMQMIDKMNDWFQSEITERHRPVMRPYTIMCVGGDAGLLECLTDAKSVDEVKKRTDGFTTLRDYFERAYGPPLSRWKNPQAPHAHGQAVPYSDDTGITFEQAQENFLKSLVGYSLVCYILQIKDRHNANILLDREGHIMHIDFGFVLGDTPKMGKVPIFSERAPFKLSGEFWDVLGGWNVNQGGMGVKFCQTFEAAFACASSHSEEIVSLVESALLNIMRSPTQVRNLANGIRMRLRMRGPPGSVEQKTFIVDLVNTALTSWGTSTYDWLQKNMNGYQ